jgi:hypothetical protein
MTFRISVRRFEIFCEDLDDANICILEVLKPVLVLFIKGSNGDACQKEKDTPGRKLDDAVPEDPVSEESLREDHGADQDIKDGEEGDQDPDSAAQKVTRDEHGKVIEVKDERDFLDEIGSEKSHDKNEGDKELLKMLHDELLDLFHDLFLFPFCPKARYSLELKKG